MSYACSALVVDLLVDVELFGVVVELLVLFFALLDAFKVAVVDVVERLVVVINELLVVVEGLVVVVNELLAVFKWLVGVVVSLVVVVK